MVQIIRMEHFIPPPVKNQKFKELHAELLPLTKDPYERSVFGLFDIMSWLESKIQGKTFAAIVKEKVSML